MRVQDLNMRPHWPRHNSYAIIDLKRRYKDQSSDESVIDVEHRKKDQSIEDSVIRGKWPHLTGDIWPLINIQYTSRLYLSCPCKSINSTNLHAL